MFVGRESYAAEVSIFFIHHATVMLKETGSLPKGHYRYSCTESQFVAEIMHFCDWLRRRIPKKYY